MLSAGANARAAMACASERWPWTIGSAAFSGSEGSGISFGANVTSKCPIDSTVWRFSDGTKSFGPSPQRAFADNGVYDGDGEDLKMIRGSDKRAKGKAVDAFEAVAYFDNGCAITFRSNRTSTGHKAFFENTIHGNRGGVQWELEDQGYLKFYSHTRPDGAKIPSRERGWTHIHVSEIRGGRRVWDFPAGEGPDGTFAV